MTNDWFDVIHGVDENAPTSKYRPHPLLFGEIDKNKYKLAIVILYSLGLIIGLFLTYLRGILVLIFSALGVFFGVFYTADPLKLKHHAVGEICVFLSFGPLMVGGAYYAISGTFSWKPIFASIPIGLLVSLVLLANNLRDKEFDRKLGISTLATGINESQGMKYYKAILFSSYLITVLLILVRVFSPFALLSFLTIKEALNIVAIFNEKVPLTSDMITAQLTLHYGVLLTLGELINVILNTII
jgi:1,4-dihydroxy-2-naphthoate octaprenyltransferase